MTRLSAFVRQRIVSLYENRHLGINIIQDILKIEENVTCSRKAVSKIIKKYRSTGIVTKDKPRSGRPVKYTMLEISDIIDFEMENNNELTARELQRKLLERNIHLSISAVKKYR